MMSSELSEISVPNIVKKILESKKNSNLHLKLEELLLSEDENTVLSSMEAVQELFIHFIDKKEMYFNEDLHSKNELDSQQKYKLWLNERYGDIKADLLCHMHSGSQVIQESALNVLMKFVEAEAINPLNNVATDTEYFPKDSFEAVISALVVSSTDMLPLVNSFQRYLKCDDIKLYTLKSLLNLLNDGTKKEESFFLQNTFVLLTKISFLEAFPPQQENDSGTETFIKRAGGEAFTLKKKDFVKTFSAVWLQFLKFKLPQVLYKKVLIYLPKKVLPHLNHPLVLTDFFTDSYNTGGVISLLSLNGIFYLIQNFNLEYPDFFKKLYALFDYEVLTSKFRARFFFLSDLFLSSTYLPAYLVAAFVKRLSRLTLFATPDVLLVILPFIRNLLIRHPSLKTLIHSPDKKTVASDPYSFEEPDPVNCKALESSLWEIKALQSHWHPDVSKKAKFINSEGGQIEDDLSDKLELSIDDMMKKEADMQFKVIPMSFDKPSGLFQRKEDTMSELWTL